MKVKRNNGSLLYILLLNESDKTFLNFPSCICFCGFVLVGRDFFCLVFQKYFKIKHLIPALLLLLYRKFPYNSTVRFECKLFTHLVISKEAGEDDEERSESVIDCLLCIEANGQVFL